MRVWFAPAGTGLPNAHASDGSPVTITDDGVFEWPFLGEGTIETGESFIIEHTEKPLD